MTEAKQYLGKKPLQDLMIGGSCFDHSNTQFESEALLIGWFGALAQRKVVWIKCLLCSSDPVARHPRCSAPHCRGCRTLPFEVQQYGTSGLSRFVRVKGWEGRTSRFCCWRRRASISTFWRRHGRPPTRSCRLWRAGRISCLEWRRQLRGDRGSHSSTS